MQKAVAEADIREEALARDLDRRQHMAARRDLLVYQQPRRRRVTRKTSTTRRSRTPKREKLFE